MKKHSDCQIDVAPFYQCCCTCKFRVASVTRYPWWVRIIADKFTNTFGLRRLPLYRKHGWACVAYDLSHVETDWPEHSCGCELHTKKSDIEPATGIF